MAFIPTQNVIRVALRHTQSSQGIINTLWFENTVDDIDDPTVLATLVNAIGTAWINNLVPLMSQGLTFVEATVTSQSSLTAPSVSQTFAQAGALAGTTLPTSNCIAVAFKTAGRGRTARGRNYFPGLTAAVVADNTVSVTHAQNIVNGYVGFNNDLVASNLTHSVVSFQQSGVPRLAGLVQYVTSYAVTDRFLDSQRRRLTGRGT